MKSILLALAMLLSASQVAAEGPYKPKGWVWVDNQDNGGKWHLGGLDKRQHFCAGMLVGSLAYVVAEDLKLKNPRMWAFVAALLVGYAKEVYDLRRGSGTGETSDIAMTALGGATSVTLLSYKW